ncbi:LCP family protein [Longirhabdus pacifica]|uniref:LCP family protein n=1 Tax=Longirhabdus pacifica TaxID=2305227 RepID=UPI001008B109|nr:LCP family protein [Longirhabdus pacifica]
MASFFVYQVFSKIEETTVERTDSKGEVTPPKVVPKLKNDEDFYSLIFGMDYRPHSDEPLLNTDSIMVAHVIPKEETIKLVSIPRDLLLLNGSNTYSKINSFFGTGFHYAEDKGLEDESFLSGRKVNLGSKQYDEIYISTGMASLREKIEALLNIEIHHTVMVNFQTVVDVVDAVGGIEIDVQRSLIYNLPADRTHINIEAGLQTLDGKNALDYARHRKDDRGSQYGSSDFERGLRQQEVVSALAEELFSWGSATKVIDLLDIMSENIKTDMSVNDMYDFIKTHYNTFNSDSIISIPFPVHYEYVLGSYHPENYDYTDVVISDDELAALRMMFQAVEPDYEIDESTSIPAITDNPSVRREAYLHLSSIPVKSEPEQQEEVVSEENNDAEQQQTEKENEEEHADETNDAEDTEGNVNEEAEGGEEITAQEEATTTDGNAETDPQESNDKQEDAEQMENDDQQETVDQQENETQTENATGDSNDADGYIMDNPSDDASEEN